MYKGILSKIPYWIFIWYLKPNLASLVREYSDSKFFQYERIFLFH